MLSNDQLETFRTRGYVNAGSLFDPERLETIAKEYDRLVTFDAQVLGNEKDGVFPYRAMLNFRSPELAACILHTPLLEIAVQLLGPDVRFWWDQGINKAPGSGSPIAWHQDNGYQPGRMPEYLTCWLALDDSSLENGGLQVVPGSQADGYREHEWQGVHAVIPDGTFDVDRAVALDARAGDMLLFSSLLLHQTVGNQTQDRNRRAWVIQYCRGDQRNDVTGEVYDNRPWAVRDGEVASELVSERPFELRREHA
ncbi:MAG: phytanoyl-CoA dioxygenase family protein [Deltaproteobacteria bacterium]|nr:phytanoyl-CoA dioxygenase family protein [Deltaproteobacteria bacterium]